jgi:beta-glucosidase-like glycosyl hydrolase
MDVIHGYQTVFPIPLGLSCTWDRAAVQQSARIAAQECSSDGINWTFSPMVDIARDPRWGRIAEGNGEDPYLGGEMAKAMVRGYQGDDLAKDNTIMACVKHFALYGASEAGRDYNTVDMSHQRMYNEYFLPYKAAIDAGDMNALGACLDENHSLCQQLTVSCKELDDLVLAARAAGAIGAKMSGTGRGGLMLALTPTVEIQDAVAKALESLAPNVWKTSFA